MKQKVLMQVFSDVSAQQLSGYSIDLNVQENGVMFGVGNNWEVSYKTGGIVDVWVSVKIELMTSYTKFIYDGPGGPHSY